MYFCTVATSWCLRCHYAAIYLLLWMVSFIRNGERDVYLGKSIPLQPWYQPILGGLKDSDFQHIYYWKILSPYNCCIFCVTFTYTVLVFCNGFPFYFFVVADVKCCRLNKGSHRGCNPVHLACNASVIFVSFVIYNLDFANTNM